MNYPTRTKAFITFFFIAAFATVAYADQLIYDNSNLTDYIYGPADIYTEFIDYGRSPGGKVCKFSFDYYTYGYSAGTIWVRFYRGTDSYDYGYFIKEFKLDAVPSASYIRKYEYVIPENHQFDLPSGDFGYSFILSSSTTKAAVASGGLGNEDWIWVYDYDWDDFIKTYFTNTWTGISMTVYATDPPDPNVCDISGYKFDDANGDGIWDAEENTMPGWEIFIDENSDGIYQDSEPNVITDPNGFYIFEDLHAPATYIIREVEKDGWTQTLPGAPDYEYVIDIEPNNVYKGYNFGNTVSDAKTVVLTAIEDTYIKEDEPDTNFGSATGVSCGLSASGLRRAFVKFDLSSIPEGQVIVSATLQMDGAYVTYQKPLVGAYYASDSWDEMTATWNDPPFIYNEPALDQTWPTIALNTWDVTEEADSQYARDGILSLALKSDELLEATCEFYSKENIFGQEPPKLIIEYEPMFGGGKGTPDDPFQIWTAEQMNTIGLYPSRWDRYYILMDDISMSAYTGTSYNIIGPTKPGQLGPGNFSGSFNGNTNVISNFSYAASNDDYIGLFGYIDEGEIRNLIVENPNITNYGYLDYVGAIAGYLSRGDIANCRVRGGSISGDYYVGGLVGNGAASAVASCSSSANVSGNKYLGGLIGGGGIFGGGILYIANCYATGSVTGGEIVGGFISDSSDATIINCYSTGAVGGTVSVGGFSALHSNLIPYSADNVQNCFWDETTSGTTESASGTGLQTGDLQDINTFLNAGWDFVGETDNGRNDDWAMPDGGGYPILWFELSPLPPLPTFAGGDGTTENPYLIETRDHLNSIGHNARLLDKHFLLINDLDFESDEFYPIAERPYSLTGTFDGNYHKIKNIQINTEFYQPAAGFIGEINGPQSAVRNLTLENIVVDQIWSTDVGGLLGRNLSGYVENCHVVDANVVGWFNIGGLVGLNFWYASIEGCSAAGQVSETGTFGYIMTPVGGLVGTTSFWSQIQSCSANVTVSGQEYLGGIVGDSLFYSPLTDCYARGTIVNTGSEDNIYAGGLLGRSYGSDIIRCYAACEIITPEEVQRVGALIGSIRSLTSSGCFWDDDINAGLVGFGYIDDNSDVSDATGLSTAEMKTALPYESKDWDFENVWRICEGTNYPRLKSDLIYLGDFVCPDGVEANDLAILIDEWLSEMPELTADIAPVSYQDGIVNTLDFVILAENWMRGTD